MTENISKAELEADGYKADARDGDADGNVQDSTKFERPEGYEIAATDGDGDGLVQDGTEFERPVGTEDETVAANLKGKGSKKKPVVTDEVATHVVSGGETDAVFLKQCVFENKYARKSLTIHHVQRRLTELGYPDAAADRDGWYGQLTKSAVEQYQQAHQLVPTGIIDEKTFVSIFAGDPNVTVNI